MGRERATTKDGGGGGGGGAALCWVLGLRSSVPRSLERSWFNGEMRVEEGVSKLEEGWTSALFPWWEASKGRSQPIPSVQVPIPKHTY